MSIYHCIRRDFQEVIETYMDISDCILIIMGFISVKTRITSGWSKFRDLESLLDYVTHVYIVFSISK